MSGFKRYELLGSGAPTDEGKDPVELPATGINLLMGIHSTLEGGPWCWAQYSIIAIGSKGSLFQYVMSPKR